MFTKIKKATKDMKLRNILIWFIFAGIVFSGCNGGPFCMHPKGDKVTVEIPMEDFDGVELAISGNVTIHRDSTLKVKITGHQNIIDNIERNIKNHTWIIEFDQCVTKTGPLEIEIWMPSLRTANVTGSGNITVLDTFDGASSFNAVLSGSGNIDVDVNAPVVKTTISGSGNIDLGTVTDQFEGTITGSGDISVRGTCTNEDLEITGSGSFHAYDFLSETASVTITGSGTCEIQVSSHLNVVITGSGDVYYKGLATVDSQITGSGRVKHVN